MVSPEVLRRYPFFGVFGEAALNEVAMATEEVSAAAGDVLFEADAPATHLYVVIAGSLDLWIVAADRHGQGLRQTFAAGEVDVGEVAGVSALIAPCVYTTRAQFAATGRVLAVEAATLRRLAAQDPQLDAALMHAVAQVTMRRLHDARVQLVGAGA